MDPARPAGHGVPAGALPCGGLLLTMPRPTPDATRQKREEVYMSGPRHSRLIILGSGPAGYAAA
jgi:hypothetical protein